MLSLVLSRRGRWKCENCELINSSKRRQCQACFNPILAISVIAKNNHRGINQIDPDPFELIIQYLFGNHSFQYHDLVQEIQMYYNQHYFKTYNRNKFDSFEVDTIITGKAGVDFNETRNNYMIYLSNGISKGVHHCKIRYIQHPSSDYVNYRHVRSFGIVSTFNKCWISDGIDLAKWPTEEKLPYYDGYTDKWKVNETITVTLKIAVDHQMIEFYKNNILMKSQKLYTHCKKYFFVMCVGPSYDSGMFECLDV